VSGAEQSSVYNFAPNRKVGWIACGKGFGVDFIQPPGGPGRPASDINRPRREDSFALKRPPL
jgi:hypothetical protein